MHVLSIMLFSVAVNLFWQFWQKSFCFTKQQYLLYGKFIYMSTKKHTDNVVFLQHSVRFD